jgi:hypothetical protein
VFFGSGSRGADPIRSQDRRGEIVGPARAAGDWRGEPFAERSAWSLPICGPLRLQPEVKSRAQQSTTVIPALRRCIISRGSRDLARPGAGNPGPQRGRWQATWPRPGKAEQLSFLAHERLGRGAEGESGKVLGDQLLDLLDARGTHYQGHFVVGGSGKVQCFPVATLCTNHLAASNSLRRCPASVSSATTTKPITTARCVCISAVPVWYRGPRPRAGLCRLQHRSLPPWKGHA